MKNLLLMTCLLVSQALWAKTTNDSLLLKIDKRDQKVIGANKDSKKTLREELEGVFEKKGLVLTDSLWQQIRTVIKTDSEGDSSLTMQIGNSRVKIGILKSGVKYKSDINMKSKPGGVTIESSGKDEVRVGWNGIHVKDGKEEVHVDWNGVHVKEPNGEETKVIWGRDSTKTQSKDKKSNLYERKGFNVYIGLNGLTGKMPENVIAIYPSPYLNSDPELKPLGSRFVSLDFSHAATIARGKKSAFKLGYGFSFDWYNFMFDHNRVVTKAASATNFQPIFDTRGDEVA